MSDHAPQIVLDTNVLIAGLRSPLGASTAMLEIIGDRSCGLHMSLPVLLQYRDVLGRKSIGLSLDDPAVERILDDLCAMAKPHDIHFLWRPVLKDPGDDLFLELAVAARAPWIVTFNLKHFRGVEAFGIRAVTPLQFLKLFPELL